MHAFLPSDFLRVPDLKYRSFPRLPSPRSLALYNFSNTPHQLGGNSSRRYLYSGAFEKSRPSLFTSSFVNRSCSSSMYVNTLFLIRSRSTGTASAVSSPCGISSGDTANGSSVSNTTPRPMRSCRVINPTGASLGRDTGEALDGDEEASFPSPPASASFPSDSPSASAGGRKSTEGGRNPPLTHPRTKVMNSSLGMSPSLSDRETAIRERTWRQFIGRAWVNRAKSPPLKCSMDPSINGRSTGVTLLTLPSLPQIHATRAICFGGSPAILLGLQKSSSANATSCRG
mmetsp:Transcript_54853/g.107312  ORF Transcript_54853/g.107312 Transcript_54853/m.107312 type:complete len:286 (-) Transcript_54853:948-1805(-)